MIIELVLVIVIIVVVGVLVINSFRMGFQLGSEREIIKQPKPESLEKIEFEEGDPLNGG